MTHNNDPLAGVPAELEAYSRGQGHWTWPTLHSLVLGCNRLLERERQQLAAVEADAAAMREAIGLYLKDFANGVHFLCRSGADYLPTTLGVEALQSALSGEAGAALLAERDSLRARVERLRRAFLLEVPNVNDAERKHLEPGDLEG